MNAEIKREIDNCFRWGADPANCYGALAIVEKYLNQLDFDDDDDMEDMIDLIVRALKLDECNIDFVTFLMNKGFDINYKLAGKQCLILKCVESFLSPAIFERLIALGADIYCESSKGDNVLLLSVEKNEELALYFVENYQLSRFNQINKFGITPLLYAAMKNYGKLAQALLKHGADVNMTGSAPTGGNGYWLDMNGVSALAIAIRHGNVEIVEMLLAAGADETLCDAKGNPPIFSLIGYPFRFFQQSCYQDPIFERKRQIVSLLKDLELTDSNGYTVLMKSLCDQVHSFEKVSAYNNLPITLALLEQGADIEAAGNDGKRPLHLAVRGIGDVYKNLVKLGADLNTKDNEGNTPLLIACKHSSEKTVRWLLKSGADFQLQNNKGESAVDIAAERGYSDALELML